MLYPECDTARGWRRVSSGPTESRDAVHPPNSPIQPCPQALSQQMHPEPGTSIKHNPQESFRSETAGMSRTVQVLEEKWEEKEEEEMLIDGLVHGDVQPDLLLGSEEMSDKAVQGPGEHIIGYERVCLVLGREGSDFGTRQEAEEGNLDGGKASKELIESEALFASEVENARESVAMSHLYGEQLKPHPKLADPTSTVQEKNSTTTRLLELGHLTLTSGETGDVAQQPENDLLPKKPGLEASALEAPESEQDFVEAVKSADTGSKINNIMEESGEIMVLIQVCFVCLDTSSLHCPGSRVLHPPAETPPPSLPLLYIVSLKHFG